MASWTTSFDGTTRIDDVNRLARDHQDLYAWARKLFSEEDEATGRTRAQEEPPSASQGEASSDDPC